MAFKESEENSIWNIPGPSNNSHEKEAVLTPTENKTGDDNNVQPETNFAPNTSHFNVPSNSAELELCNTKLQLLIQKE